MTLNVGLPVRPIEDGVSGKMKPVILTVNDGLSVSYIRVAGGVVTMRSAGKTGMSCSMLGAAEYVPLPACDAIILTVPTPVKLTVFPERTPGPVTLYDTARPELAVAESVTAPVP